MPRDTTPEDIAEAYFDGWRLGLKALAIYRDGSKESQPLNTAHRSRQGEGQGSCAAKPRRERLPDTRQSITHKFSVAGHEGYITVGLFDDGRPGELFITMAKEGSTIGGLMDAFGTAVSMSLQYGVPLEDYVRKFSHMRFEPQGHTKNPDIRIAKSLVDYIFRWLGITFLPGYKEASLGMPLDGSRPAPPAGPTTRLSETQLKPVAKKADGRKASSEASAGSQKLRDCKAASRKPVGSPRASRVVQRPRPTANGQRPHGNGHGKQRQRPAARQGRRQRAPSPLQRQAPRARRRDDRRPTPPAPTSAANSSPSSRSTPRRATTAARSPSATATATSATTAATAWAAARRRGELLEPCHPEVLRGVRPVFRSD